jgi:hypothetical protein
MITIYRYPYFSIHCSGYNSDITSHQSQMKLVMFLGLFLFYSWENLSKVSLSELCDVRKVGSDSRNLESYLILKVARFILYHAVSLLIKHLQMYIIFQWGDFLRKKTFISKGFCLFLLTLINYSWLPHVLFGGIFLFYVFFFSLVMLQKSWLLKSSYN